jgi:flagellar basal body-associated protein FliL
MKKKMIIIFIIIAVVAISVGLYTILPLFTNTVVDEPLPTASGMSLSPPGLDELINEKGYSQLITI